jgi:long-chain acyl-CoA synthetase
MRARGWRAIVLTQGMTNPGAVIRAVEEHTATGLSAVPTSIAMLMKLFRDRLGESLSSIRYLEVGSAPMRMDHKLQLIDLLPQARICMHYGLTEAARSAFIEFHSDRDHLDSIGKPTPNVDIRVLDYSGQMQPDGEIGRLAVRGDVVAQSYWQDQALDDAARQGDWFVTGDLGYRDQDGYLYLTDRESDIINASGHKVAPSEVESELLNIPGIADCACVGETESTGVLGEQVVAYLVRDDEGDASPTDAEIKTILRAQVEQHAMPRHFRWIDAIPRTNSGKILRRELRSISDTGAAVATEQT